MFGARDEGGGGGCEVPRMFWVAIASSSRCCAHCSRCFPAGSRRLSPPILTVNLDDLRYERSATFLYGSSMTLRFSCSCRMEQRRLHYCTRGYVLKIWRGGGGGAAFRAPPDRTAFECSVVGRGGPTSLAILVH